MGRRRKRKRHVVRHKRGGPRYRVAFRRRREGKTNYHLRRKLTLNKHPRLITRPSNKHILAQVAYVELKGDKVLVSAHSKELNKYGWKGSCGNVSAAYLVGLIIGSKAKKRKIPSAILDIGLSVPVYGSRIFAMLRGAVEAGLDVPHSDVVFPSDERIIGQHISAHAAQLKSEDENRYKQRFSGYFKRGLDPEDLPTHFETVKKSILEQVK
ncbi:MAG: 50S ribosomal protein L18 [Promethearchaeota archaeon]